MMESKKMVQFWYAVVPYQYHALALLVFFGSLLQFLPFFAGYHDTIIEHSAIRTNLHSIENMIASAVLIALVVPLGIDGILDFTIMVLMDHNKAKEITDILNYVERSFIYTGILVLPCCAFISQQYSDLALFALCCSHCQSCMVFGGCLMSIARIAPHCFPGRLCMLALVCQYVSSVLSSLSYVSLHANDKLNVISIIFQFLDTVIRVGTLMHWIWLTFLSHCFTKQTSATLAIAIMDDHNQSSNGYDKKIEMSLKDDIQQKNNMFVLVLVMILIVCNLILHSNSAAFIDYTPTQFAVVHVSFGIFAVGLLIHHLRKFRSDALLRLHALVNKKATLLKCVHELYEPINTIFESQKHVMEEIGEVSDKKVVQFYYFLLFILNAFTHMHW